MTNKIEIKNLTIVVNLMKTSASSYLNFMEDSKKTKKLDTCEIITFSKVSNNYLVIYIDNKPTEKLLTKLVIDSLISNKIDFIAIDELFPDDNTALLNKKDCLNNSKWVISRFFDAKTSLITVKI
jgi:uncharacterized protein YlbG (UPF0298 family)